MIIEVCKDFDGNLDIVTIYCMTTFNRKLYIYQSTPISMGSLYRMKSCSIITWGDKLVTIENNNIKIKNK